MLQEIWNNETLWLPISAMVAVQIFKFIVASIRNRTLAWPILFSTGGMPSSHSAMVTSLATAVAYRNGIGSSVFGVAVVLAAIIMYDAQGIRQQSGKQARVLNRILRELFSGQPISEEELKELLGHTSFEVLVGGVVGVVYAIFLEEFLLLAP